MTANLKYVTVFVLLMLVPCCRRRVELQTAAVINGLGGAYRNYVRDVDSFESLDPIDERLGPAILKGDNRKKSPLLILPDEFVDSKGRVLDEWRRILIIRISDRENRVIEIRSIGKDGVAHTDDDLVQTFSP